MTKIFSAIAMFFASVAVGLLLLSFVDRAYAADTPPVNSAADLTMIIALIVAVMIGASALIHSVSLLIRTVAAATKTKADDAVLLPIADKLDSAHDKIDSVAATVQGILSVLPKPTPTPIPAVVSLVPPVVLALLLIGSLQGCAAVKAAPEAAVTAVIDCVKADQQPIVALVVQLAADALTYVLGGGVVDWSALESSAWTQGKVTGGCAFAELVHGVTGKAGSSVAHVSQVDPARAALERLRARAGGVQWLTPDGAL